MTILLLKINNTYVCGPFAPSATPCCVCVCVCVYVCVCVCVCVCVGGWQSESEGESRTLQVVTVVTGTVPVWDSQLIWAWYKNKKQLLKSEIEHWSSSRYTLNLVHVLDCINDKHYGCNCLINVIVN
jgi:hypothetical protein